MRILFTGGGTSGHIIPLLAVAEEIRKIKSADEKLEFMFIGSGSDFNKAISDAGIKVKTIQAGKLRRYFSLENFTDIFKTIFGVIQSLYFVYKFQPDIVFSKGGFASIPPVIAAWILKIPVFSHESDIVPGLANKMISRFANKIFISFKETEKYFPGKKIILTDSLIREDILKGDKSKAKEIFGLKENIPTILVFGGSQGARKINQTILEILPRILGKYQIIHICGAKNYKEVKNTIDKKEFNPETSELGYFLSLINKRYRLYPYLNDKLKDAFALCDIIISRAGANSLFEIIALNKPSIIIPLPTSANNHQFHNAEFFAKKGMITTIKEENLTADILTNEIFKLLQESDYRSSMIKKIEKHNRNKKNATFIIAEEIAKMSQNFNKKSYLNID